MAVHLGKSDSGGCNWGTYCGISLDDGSFPSLAAYTNDGGVASAMSCLTLAIRSE